MTHLPPLPRILQSVRRLTCTMGLSSPPMTMVQWKVGTTPYAAQPTNVNSFMLAEAPMRGTCKDMASPKMTPTVVR